MNKYNNKSNITGILINHARTRVGLSFEKLSSKLQLMNICLYPNDLFLIEKQERIIKDFELIAICQILQINLYDIKL